MGRTTDEKLDDSINVPLPKALKKRVVRLAQQEPNSPSYTKFARSLIREGVERRESRQTVGAR